MTLDPAGLEAAAKALTKALDDVRGGYDHAENPTEACVRAYLAAAVPTDGKTLSREFDEDGRALCFQCGEPQSAHPDGEECVGREYARGFAAGRAAATPDPPSDRNVARMFHEAYERLAPEFGYHTREESAVPWERVPARNRDLMTATVGEVRAHLAAASPDERLREAVAALPQYVITIQDREGYTYERGCAGQPMNYTGVMLADVEALIGELKDGAPAAREATDELKDALRAIASFDAAGDARFDYLDVIRVKEIARLALAAADRGTACTDRENAGVGGAVTRGIVPSGTDDPAAADREKPEER